LQLLGAAGFEFEAVQPEIAERTDPNLTARELTAWNAVRKGMAVARRYPKRVVLAADTVVALRDQIIGKPADLAQAEVILGRLSGQIHHVHTSVFIAHLAAARASLFCEVSRVRFRKLNQDQIRNYLTKIDPLDKAGAYAAQGHGSEIIARVDGSYSNVVGLPMEQTIAALAEFGIQRTRPVSRHLPSQVRLARAGEAVPAARRGKGTKR
jgi:septum formation protein